MPWWAAPVSGRGAEIDGARHAAAGGKLAEIGQLAVEPQRQRVGAVDVLLDHRRPVVGEVAGQLELDARVVDGDVGGEDERVLVALLPQAVDDGRHQPQHAARALELDQRGPVAIEAVEDLGVDGIGGAHALLVVGVAALGRELLLLAAVEVGKRPRHHVAVLELGGVAQRLEQAPAHDLKALLGRGRAPRRLDAAHHVAQAVERLAAALAAHLDVVGARVRRAGGIGGGQRDDQQAVRRQAGGLGQRLGKGELRLEGAAGQVAAIVQLAGIGHPLVDEDEAGAVVDKELAQLVAGVGGAGVVGRDAVVGGPAAQLPGQFAPQRSAPPCRRAW